MFGGVAGQSSSAGGASSTAGTTSGSGGQPPTTDGGGAGEPTSNGEAGEASAGMDSGGTDAGGTDNGGTDNGGTSSTGGNAGTSSGGTSTGSSGSGGSSATFDPELGLVAHFPFDETSGTVVTNVTNSAKNGAYKGAPTHPLGQLGNAVQLRNLSPSAPDWIELPAGLLSDLSTTTITLWARDLSPTRQGARLLHFSLGSSDEIYFAPDEVNSGTSNPGSHLGGTHGGSSFVDLWTTAPLVTDKAWHHVAFTWSASIIKLYMDGSLRGTKSNPAATPQDLGATSPNWLGRTLDDAYIAIYAELDDLRVYDKVLTDADVAQLYVLR